MNERKNVLLLRKAHNYIEFNISCGDRMHLKGRFGR